MLAYLAENIATIIICAVLIAAVTAIIVSMIRKRKKGKSTCGCGCSDCSMSPYCHTEK